VPAAVTDHEVSLGRVIRRRHKDDVAGCEAGARQPDLDGLRGFRGSICMGGVYFHQTLQHVARQLLVRGRGSGAGEDAHAPAVTAAPKVQINPFIEFSSYLKFTASHDAPGAQVVDLRVGHRQALRENFAGVRSQRRRSRTIGTGVWDRRSGLATSGTEPATG